VADYVLGYFQVPLTYEDIVEAFVPEEASGKEGSGGNGSVEVSRPVEHCISSAGGCFDNRSSCEEANAAD